MQIQVFFFVKVNIITENQQIIFQIDNIPRKKQQLIAGGGGLVTQSCLTLVSPWSIAWQASPSMGFPRQEQWNGLPFFFSRGSAQWAAIFLFEGLNLHLLHCRWILYQLSHQVKYFLKNIPNAFSHSASIVWDWGYSKPQGFPWRKIFIFLFIYF